MDPRNLLLGDSLRSVYKIVDFTQNAYINLLNLLSKNRYEFSSYQEVEKSAKAVILRHDVDFSLEKALEMSKIEYRNNAKSTYFVLLTSNFYNLYSKESFEILQSIISMGHEIGLHFDEKRYILNSIDDIRFNAAKEANILSEIVGREIRVISMHRPSLLILDSNIQFDNLINSYSSFFFKSMKYISDSRMKWREDPIEIINSNHHDKLHILTHPFWYSLNNESMRFKLNEFLYNAIIDRYSFLNDNIRDLNEEINLNDSLLEVIKSHWRKDEVL